MFCPQCGTELPEGSRFCGACGAQLTPATEGATAGSANAPSDASGDMAAATEAAGAPSHVAVPGSAQAETDAIATSARKSRKTGLIVGGIAVVAIVALAVGGFFLARALGMFGGGADRVNQVFNNAALSYNAVADADGWDYFYSDTTHAIMRGKADGTVETVMAVPVEETDYGYAYPNIFIQALAVDGQNVFYACHPMMMDENTKWEIHRFDMATSEDSVIYAVGPAGGDEQRSVQEMYLYDHELYLLVNSYEEPFGSSFELVVLDTDGNELRREDKFKESDGRLPMAGITPTRDVYAVNDYDDGTSSGRLYVADSAQGDVAGNLVFEMDDGSISNFALSGDRVVFTAYGSARDVNTVMVAGADGSDAQGLYTIPSGTWGSLVAATDDTVFVMQYADDALDVVTWNLVAVPVSGGEPQTIASNLDYYNPSVAVVNGHLLIMENGQDISSQGMRAAAYSFDGELLATYVG